MLPENNDAAHGSSMPSHCAVDRPSVGSQSPSVRDHPALACSRSFAAAKQVANADVPALFHAAINGHVRSGRTGETNRGSAVPFAATVIEALKLCAPLGAPATGG